MRTMNSNSIKNQGTFLEEHIVSQLIDFSKGILHLNTKVKPEQSVYGEIDAAIKRADGQTVQNLSRYLTMLFMARV